MKKIVFCSSGQATPSSCHIDVLGQPTGRAAAVSYESPKAKIKTENSDSLDTFCIGATWQEEIVIYLARARARTTAAAAAARPIFGKIAKDNL